MANNGTSFRGPLKVAGVVIVDESGNIDAPVTTSNLTTTGTTTLGNDVTDDTTISGDLVVDVDASFGGATVLSGTVVTSGTTTTSGAGAVATTGSIHEVTTTGTGDALSLIDGAEGQRLAVVYVAEAAGGDTAVLTPTNLAAGSTVTFNAVGDSADLLFTAGTWFVLGGAAVVA